MIIYKCKMCGANLPIEEEKKIVKCEYCGTFQSIPTCDDERKAVFINRANHFRQNGEFDKACSIFEHILEEDETDPEVYWSIVLCRFGIEYVEDPITKMRKMTVNRTQKHSILQDADYLMAIEKADDELKKFYADEAAYVDTVQKKILCIAREEKDYDVFISYKEKGPDGNRTRSSVLAQDLYDRLEKAGYRTFFSRISLEDKLGSEYEPYIYSALNSAEVMLVLGTNKEEFVAPWVKNEWSRYLLAMRENPEKRLIPCYCDIDVYDLPDEFQILQGQDMGKIGAIQDLMRGIDKLVGKKEKEIKKSNIENHDLSPRFNAIMTRGWLALEDGAWEKAYKYFDDVLNYDAKLAMAYLGIVCAMLEVHNPEELPISGQDYTNNPDFEKFLRFAGKEEKLLMDKLRSLESEQKILQEKQRKEQEEEKRKYDEESKKQKEEYQKSLLVARERNLKANGLIWAGPEGMTIGKKTDGTLLMVGDYDLKWTAVKDIVIGSDHVAGIWSSGRTLAIGNNSYGQCGISGWKKIVQIGVGDGMTLGLRENGQILYEGSYFMDIPCIWTDVTSIVVGNNHYVGIKSNGTVFAHGANEHGQCNVSQWKNISEISLGPNHTVGLCKDGTAIATGLNEHGMCDVSDWKNIIKVEARKRHTIGLCIDGTVVAVGDNEYGQCDVSQWEGVIDVASGERHTVGLRFDGTVVATGGDDENQCAIEDWKDIIFIACGPIHTIGLSAEGKVFSTMEEDDLSSWRLFERFDDLDNERNQWLEKIKNEREQLLKEYSALKGVIAIIKKREIDVRLAQIDEYLHQWD